MTYKTKGTCSTAIDIEVNDGIIVSSLPADVMVI